jgi:Cu-Zn family superoxide dismutase
MNRRLNVLALVGALSLLSCTANAAEQGRARAEIKNAQGKSVGTASLRETKDGLLIIVNAKGLPEGLHAVHIHSVGRCEGPAFASAGGHFNPLNKKHGLKNPPTVHTQAICLTCT